jgi:hypothetical protein
MLPLKTRREGEGSVLRGILLGLCLVVLLTVAALLVVPRGGGSGRVSPSSRPTAAHLRRPEAPPKKLVTLSAPSFDVVTVAPDGTAVIAGRAAPGSVVRVLEGSEALGEVVADRRGEWVLIPDRPLTAGGRRLTLRSTVGQGPVVASAETVFVNVPHAPSAPAGPPSAVALPAGRAYIVQRGNSLWRIARQFLGAGIHYLAIYSTNLGQIRDPDLIYPGQVFKLPKS